MLIGHMLMLEGNGVRAACCCEQILVVVVIAHHNIRGDLRGRRIRATSKNPQMNIEFRGGRLHHARQLTIATDSYNRF